MAEVAGSQEKARRPAAAETAGSQARASGSVAPSRKMTSGPSTGIAEQTLAARWAALSLTTDDLLQYYDADTTVILDRCGQAQQVLDETEAPEGGNVEPRWVVNLADEIQFYLPQLSSQILRLTFGCEVYPARFVHVLLDRLQTLLRHLVEDIELARDLAATHDARDDDRPRPGPPEARPEPPAVVSGSEYESISDGEPARSDGDRETSSSWPSSEDDPQ